jgi:hypothetical protein
MAKRIENVSLEGAEVLGGIFKNFSGKASQYNPAGRRTFCIRLDKRTADAMADEGWNIKTLDPREDGDEPIYYIQARIRFDNVPPTVFMLTGRKNKKTRLDEDTIDLLDSSIIEWCDVTLSPYHWEIKTKEGVSTGITAYVKTLYVKVEEDEFAAKYNDDIPYDGEEVPFN